MIMELGAYQVKLTKYPADKRMLVEVYTKHDELPAQQYCQIMHDVMHYLGAEGFFNESLPSKFGIYNKFGQLVQLDR
jgi:hypothetical protein